MAELVKAREMMHKLLIEKDIDGFTVVELRDSAVADGFCPDNLSEARKKLYRQLLRFVENNWLTSQGSGRDKQYFQTDLFKRLHTQKTSASSALVSAPAQDYSVLHIERNQYKGELEIILGEIEEYQSLKQRFPELKAKIGPLLALANERSARLVGKMDGLTKALKSLSEDEKC